MGFSAVQMFGDHHHPDKTTDTIIYGCQAKKIIQSDIVKLASSFDTYQASNGGCISFISCGKFIFYHVVWEKGLTSSAVPVGYIFDMPYSLFCSCNADKPLYVSLCGGYFSYTSDTSCLLPMLLPSFRMSPIQWSNIS